MGRPEATYGYRGHIAVVDAAVAKSNDFLIIIAREDVLVDQSYKLEGVVEDELAQGDCCVAIMVTELGFRWFRREGVHGYQLEILPQWKHRRG